MDTHRHENDGFWATEELWAEADREVFGFKAFEADALFEIGKAGRITISRS